MMQQKSLQRELYRWIILSALVLVVFGGAIAGALAFQQARELQDNTLIEISLLVRNGQLDFSDFNEDEQHARRKKKLSEKIHDRNEDFRDEHNIEDETTIIIHELGISDNLKGIPPDISDGLKTITLGDDKWRVLVMSQFYSDRRFIIAQPTELRNNIAWSSSISTFLPILLLVSILLLMIHIIIRRQFKSLNLLVKNIDRQDGTQLKELSEKNIPLEIIPFVSSINALISRVKQVMHKQHRFIADAAHELRTPITALSLQAENVTHANDDAERNERQKQLKQGFDRLGNLVAQLLDLARLQSSDEVEAQTVSFNDVVKSAIADLFPLAESAEIDLGMLHQDKAINVKDQNGRLGQLVHNAIGNAIHYTPASGKVDISLFKQGNKAILLVEDTGIGIPEDELQQVMEPFYRVLESGKPGNGLGLAISHEIAEHLNGKIHLSNRKQGGLCFRYEQDLVSD
ncbi:ATP-binding protein [Cocleimonas sp. KMM 6892]|uniref:sensor histidine kinase n=1 Tax=unclassified Cocleimonas TaxID=2639732 RepID=UPI002DBD177C|nr:MULTISPECIES: ATP-binding protein [unclassified Cocleimonas]MEB8431912.1 ATP-binding protein [Cocleimonas sp. KMM 6892]MEC4715002.1 ATP-binding protein [Cocleimonas sp. KMM 6895]MEC4744184.1 ATP-binding protein [Cocleimonas sp. KMM 6896]